MDGFVSRRDDYVLPRRFRSPKRRTRIVTIGRRSITEHAHPQRRLPSDAAISFRYDHGVTNVHPKSALGRLLLRKIRDVRSLLGLAKNIPRLLPKTPMVTVDMLIPFSRLDRFSIGTGREIDFYPLWCVPYRRVRDYEWIAKGYFDDVPDPLFVDLAIYGLTQPANRNLYAEIEVSSTRSRNQDAHLAQHYDQETFWRIWNKPKLRRREEHHGSDERFEISFEDGALAARDRRALARQETEHGLVTFRIDLEVVEIFVDERSSRRARPRPTLCTLRRARRRPSNLEHERSQICDVKVCPSRDFRWVLPANSLGDRRELADRRARDPFRARGLRLHRRAIFFRVARRAPTIVQSASKSTAPTAPFLHQQVFEIAQADHEPLFVDVVTPIVFDFFQQHESIFFVERRAAVNLRDESSQMRAYPARARTLPRARRAPRQCRARASRRSRKDV